MNRQNKYLAISVVAIFFFLPLTAQLNQLDSNGLKTGKWIKYYPNGKVFYEGEFEDGKPVGKLTRYYENGMKKAEMQFMNDGIVSYAKLYYENGDLAAEGKFIHQLRDSTWNFYSFYNQRLAIKEEYKNGKKNGVSIKYFDNNETAEILFWKDDIMHGKWEQFFENGQQRLKCRHVDGKRDGEFISYHNDGTLSIAGNYKMGTMTGKWTYYKEDNEVDLVLEYLDGKMLPNAEYEARQKEFSRLLDESVGDYSEPNFMEMR